MPLTDKQIKALQPEEKARKYFDGAGLYLEVSPRGGKWWRLKYRFGGKDKRISLGVYPAVSLKDAREAAQEMKAGLRKGLDPAAERRREGQQEGKLFEAVAEEWFERQAPLWTPEHADKVRARLEGKIYSALGRRPVAEITAPEILSLCRIVENSASAYMSHVIHGLISRVMRFGVACGYLQSDPCRDLRGALTPFKKKHMPAIIDPVQVGRLALRIDGYEGQFTTRCAMQILLLCMCRTKEVRGARWEELDLENAMWRIPAERMKMRREHLIPLSRQAVTIFSDMRALTGRYELVFPSVRSKSRQMSENTINAALRNMGYEAGEVVGHGFRSTASTLLNELGWTPDVIEAQLAHASQGGVRAAYNRAAYLEDRRRMLQAWADHIDLLKERAARG